MPLFEPLPVKELFPKILQYHFTRLKSSQIAINQDMGFINLASYARYVHLQKHTNYEVRPYQWRGRTTDIYTYAGMLPARREFIVKACLFLGSDAPGCFRNNLVLLGSEGDILFFSPERNSLKMTAEVQLGRHCHALASSPLSSTLLLADVNSVIVRLKDNGALDIFATRVRVKAETFTRDCFVSETSFLTIDERDCFWLHSLDPDESGHPRLSSTVFFHRRCYGPSGSPFNHCSVASKIFFVYKRACEYSHDCLVLAEENTVDRVGLGSQIRLIYNPGDPYEQEDIYIHFSKCLISDIVLHPENGEGFVIVITHMDKWEFFHDVDTKPKTGFGEESREKCEGFNYEVPGDPAGRVAVYRINFCGAFCEPIYFLTCMKTYSSIHVSMTDNFEMYKSPDTGLRRINAQCNLFSLIICLDYSTMAHVPLMSDHKKASRSGVCYQTVIPNNKWAFSRQGTYAVFYRGYQSLLEEELGALRLCPSLDLAAIEDSDTNTSGTAPSNVPYFDSVTYL